MKKHNNRITIVTSRKRDKFQRRDERVKDSKKVVRRREVGTGSGVLGAWGRRFEEK